MACRSRRGAAQAGGRTGDTAAAPGRPATRRPTCRRSRRGRSRWRRGAGRVGRKDRPSRGLSGADRPARRSIPRTTPVKDGQAQHRRASSPSLANTCSVARQRSRAVRAADVTVTVKWAPRAALQSAALVRARSAGGGRRWSAAPRPRPPASLPSTPSPIVRFRSTTTATRRRRPAKACHPDQYSTWHASYHRTMTQVATPETALADFDGVTVSGVHGRPMTLTRRGHRALGRVRRSRFERRARSAPAHRAAGRDDHRVASPAGVLVRDRPEPAARPAAWRVPDREQRWIPRRAAVLHPPTDPPFSETGHWNSTCIACHATHGKPRVRHAVRIAADRDADGRDDRRRARHRVRGVSWAERAHARANRNPLRRYAQHLTGGPDPTTSSRRGSTRGCRRRRAASATASGSSTTARASARRIREGCRTGPAMS